MLRRTAPASRPSGRCAVGLRPSLDPDAFLGVPGTYGERPKKDQQHPLTGPVPSGMTCGIANSYGYHQFGRLGWTEFAE